MTLECSGSGKEGKVYHSLSLKQLRINSLSIEQHGMIGSFKNFIKTSKTFYSIP